MRTKIDQVILPPQRQGQKARKVYIVYIWVDDAWIPAGNGQHIFGYETREEANALQKQLRRRHSPDLPESEPTAEENYPDGEMP